MRILMLCFNMVGRGTYLRAYEFARCLVSQKHHVTLMAVSPNRRIGIRNKKENGIEIVATPDLFPGPLRSGWDPLQVLSRIRWLKNREFDLVHAFEARPICFYPARYMQQRGVPMLLDWSDWLGSGGSVEQRPTAIVRMILRPVETFFENHSRKNAAANTVICSTLYHKAMALGVNHDYLSLIPNGFDMPGWTTFTKKEARKTLSLGEYQFLVGYIGSLFPSDAGLMSRSFDLLQERLPQSQLIHIGQSNYYSINHPSIISTGYVNQVKLSQYLSACDVCWLPFEDTSANRGRFPLKFSNYLAAGKPIVATHVGDVAEIISNEGVGSTCSPTPQGLASAVYHFYENPEARRVCTEKAVNLTQDPYHSWSTRTAKLMRLYQKIISD